MVNRIFVVAAGILTSITLLAEVKKITSVPDFYNELGQNLLVVVKFSSPSCGPCRQFGPTIEKSSTLHPVIAFLEVSLESPDMRSLAHSLGVSSIPTTLFFVRGARVLTKIGAQSPYQLEKSVKEAFPNLF